VIIVLSGCDDEEINGPKVVAIPRQIRPATIGVVVVVPRPGEVAFTDEALVAEILCIALPKRHSASLSVRSQYAVATNEISAIQRNQASDVRVYKSDKLARRNKTKFVCLGSSPGTPAKLAYRKQLGGRMPVSYAGTSDRFRPRRLAA
jgi:hypothetical protein